MHKRVASLALCIGCALPCLSQNPISGLQLIEDPPTLTTLGFQLRHSGDDNRNASMTWQYRQLGDTAWRDALPMLRVLPETVPARTLARQFAGSIFDLRPGTQYQIQVQVSDPDGGSLTLSATSTTRAVPVDPASPRTISVTDSAGLRNALSSAQAGDIVILQNGTYAVQSLVIGASGTAANPVILRGSSQSGVILDGGNCADCNILEIYGDYFRVESMTLQNAFQAVRFQGSAARGNMARRLTIRNVTNGIAGRGTQRDFYLADNTLQGRLSFPLVYSSDNGANSDSYGIAIFGSGYAVAHNQISGFANGIQHLVVGSRANDIYGNDIIFSYDDAVEADGSEGNIRIFRNRMTNVYTSVSFQPVFGGPVYFFRNIAYNIKYEQMKFHSRAVTPVEEPSGVLSYHNTFVSPDREMNMESGATNHNSFLMNNVFLGPPTLTGGQAIDWAATLDRVLFNYNGYYPDGKVFFHTAAIASNVTNFSAVAPTFGLEQNGRLLSASTLANAVLGPDSFSTLRTPLDATLSANSLALDAGVALANINDFYTGGAPDLGALERGCPVPVYGPRPAGVDESNHVTGCSASAPPANTPPTVDSFSVAKGTGNIRQFSVTVSDQQGATDIQKIAAVFGSAAVVTNDCAVELERATGQMYLWNDAGNARLGALAVGAQSQIQNSRCTVDGVGSSAQTGTSANQYIWKVNVTLKGDYRTLRTAFVSVNDAVSSSGWRNMGTWK